MLMKLFTSTASNWMEGSGQYHASAVCPR